MVPEVTRLWFYFTIYSRKDKYKGGYFVKEGSSGHKGWQQRCSSTQGRVMDKENYGRSDNAEKKQNNRQPRINGRNMKK